MGNPVARIDPTGEATIEIPVPDFVADIPEWLSVPTGRALGLAGAILSLSGDTPRNCPENDCNKKLSDEFLKRLGINAHGLKHGTIGDENAGWFDLCGCKDGRIVVKRLGCQGKDEPADTGSRWK